MSISYLTAKPLSRLNEEFFTSRAGGFLAHVGFPSADPSPLAAWATGLFEGGFRNVAGCFVTESGEVLGNLTFLQDPAHDMTRRAAPEVVKEFSLASATEDMACVQLSRIVGETVIIADYWQATAKY